MTSSSHPWQTLPDTPSLPASPQSGYAAVNGIRMYYAIFGAGTPVLLLHGGLANANYWGHVIPILVRHRFQVIVADSRGHGRSTRTEAAFSYELMTADVLALLDCLKLETVDVVGWSDGGIIALVLAMRHPERLRRAFVSGANSDPSGVHADVDTHPLFRTFVERTRTEYEQLSPMPADYASFRAGVQTMWALQPQYAAADLQGISIPTAIADGAHDEAITPEHSRYLARTIPGATLITLPDVSHFGVLQNPGDFGAKVIAFLR
jgi:pimeloyl-ACP methyl ester carboxylesterase